MGGSEIKRVTGARCDECALKGSPGPVASEVRAASRLTIVTDHPREGDVRKGRLLSGSAGLKLLEVMEQVGLSRSEVSIVPAVACDPGAELPVVKAGPSPAECCRGRLLRELGAGVVVTLGATAYEAVMGRPVEMLEVRGGPIFGPRLVLPTVHPGLLSKTRKWDQAFRVDLDRARRWTEGRLTWAEPRVAFNPPVGALAAFLARPGPFGFDVETTMSGLLKCLAVADEAQAVVVRFASVEGDGGRLVQESAYRDDEWEQVQAVLRGFLSDPGKLKVAHNGVLFDVAVLERVLGLVARPVVDTLLLHRAVDVEAPHDLGFVASLYTDAPAWKAAHDRGTRSDEELGRYCALDAIATVRLAGPLSEQATGLERAVAHDHAVQAAYRRMGQLGLPVDEERVKGLGKRWAREAMELDGQVRELAGMPSLNIASRADVRKLLFEKLGLTPQRYTSTGAPSIDDEGLRLLRLSAGEEHAALIDALRRRGRLGAAQRQFAGLEVRSGRLFWPWSIQSELAEWPWWLKGLLKMDWLVSERVPTGRLQVAAELAGLAEYLDHSDWRLLSAELMVGPAVRSLTGSKREAALRLAGDVVRVSLAGDDDEAVWKALLRLEDESGRPRHAGLSIRESATLRRRWLGRMGELEAWRRKVATEAKEGRLVDPLVGRKAPMLFGPEAVRWLLDTVVRTKVEQMLLEGVEAGKQPVALVGREIVWASPRWP